MERKQNQCLTLSCSSVMYLALASQADQREKGPARSGGARNPPLPGGEGRPVYHQTPCAQGEAGSKPVVQEFLLDSWIYEWEYWVPPWLLCKACWALPVGCLLSSSQQIPRSPMGVAVSFPKKRD